MQVTERGQHRQQICDGIGHRQRVGQAAVVLPALLELAVERLAADVLHHDVARAPPRDEVVDAHDAAVFDAREELALGDRGGDRVGVARAQQALQHDPPVGYRSVAREIDPAETAVREAAHDLVLIADEITFRQRGQVGREIERCATVAAESLDPARTIGCPAADGASARGAEPLFFGAGADDRGDLLVAHHRREGIADRSGCDLDQTGAQLRARARGSVRRAPSRARPRAGRGTHAMARRDRRADGGASGDAPGRRDRRRLDVLGAARVAVAVGSDVTPAVRTVARDHGGGHRLSFGRRVRTTPSCVTSCSARASDVGAVCNS